MYTYRYIGGLYGDDIGTYDQLHMGLNMVTYATTNWGLTAI